MSSKNRLHVLDPIAGSPAAEDEVLVPDDSYEVAFSTEKKYRWHNVWMWRCEFKIVQQGSYFGLLVPAFFRLPLLDRPLRRSHALARTYVTVTGSRFPKDLARHRPSWFLKDCVLKAKTRVPLVDVKGVKRAREAGYSVVDCIVERVSGTPPCQSGAGR